MVSAAHTDALAAAAARLVVDEGMDYDSAKRKAARQAAGSGGGNARRAELPSHEQIEDQVREHIALFCADTQPAELQALRELALTWMERLAEFRPHLAGAVWRGTATRLSLLQLDLYCDDPKAAEIALVNRGIDYDAASLSDARGRQHEVLSLAVRCPALGDWVTLHLHLHDLDDQRGALKPDSRGRSWRGDTAALRRLLAEPAAERP